MNSIIESVKNVLAKLTFLPNDELKLAIIGAVATIVFFLVALAISGGSKMNALRKKIQKFIVKVAGMAEINETNVEAVYRDMTALPKPVQKGWGNFLNQRDGYPSDYITSRDGLAGKDYEGKHTGGKVVFVVLSVILWFVLAFLTVAVCKDDLASFGIADITSNFVMVGSILLTVLLPVVFFVIFYFLLRNVYDKQRTRLEMFFASMQDILDERTMIACAEENEYDGTSMEAISEQVEELTDGRMEDDVIEVLELPDGIEEELPEEIEEEVSEEVTDEEEEDESEVVEEEVPVDDGIGEIVYPDEEEDETVEEPEETTEVEPVPVEEPTATEEPIEEEHTVEEEPTATEEVVPEEEPAVEAPVEVEPVILTREEEETYLQVLPEVVSRAIEDPATTKDELEEIAVIIDNALTYNFKDPKEQEILINCLQLLADKFYEDEQ